MSFIPSATIGLATPVPPSTTEPSSIINTGGLNSGSVGLMSDKTGTLSVQRYIDSAGLLAVGAPLTAAITATGTPVAGAVSWGRGLAVAAGTAPSVPIGSIIVSFINGTGAVANLTNITVNLAP